MTSEPIMIPAAAYKRNRVARDGEGHKPDQGVMQHEKSVEVKRNRGGRPKGSKTRAKSLIPQEVANELLLKLQPLMTPEQYDYMKGVIRDGKSIIAERELDVLIAALRVQVLTGMAVEADGVDETAGIPKEMLDELGITEKPKSLVKMPAFSKDVTERLKVLQSLLGEKLKMERSRDEAADNRSKPILEIFARRGIGAERLGVAVGPVPGGLGGSTDYFELRADGTRALPDSVLERPISAEDSGEEQADWVLDVPVD